MSESFSETKFLQDSEVTATYMDTLLDLNGKVNKSHFLGIPRGKLLLIGASGSQDDNRPWRILFSFEILERSMHRKYEYGDFSLLKL